MEAGSEFNPRQLQSSIKARYPDRQTVTGSAPMQAEADAATNTIAKVLPERSQISIANDIARWGSGAALFLSPPGTAAAAVGSGMLSQPVRRVMTGQAATPRDAATARAIRLLGLETTAG